MLTVIDEFTRRCLAILTATRLRSDDVLHCLTDLMSRHGSPEHIRSDNGPEFVAKRPETAGPSARTPAAADRATNRKRANRPAKKLLIKNAPN
jgi:transposase InsO family protein